jgi:hypothetical protein
MLYAFPATDSYSGGCWHVGIIPRSVYATITTMAKVLYTLRPPDTDWWFVSFDHVPFEDPPGYVAYRNADSVHVVHCYPVYPLYIWPERIWEKIFQTRRIAEGFLSHVLSDPWIFADLCYCCNIRYPGVRQPRWNIHRGPNKEWLPSRTYYEPWNP